MDKKQYVPVLLITGYLGSGKTTLLNRILHNGEGVRYAVIVNDIGEVNIDAEMIQKGGIVGQGDGAQADDLVALQNGCICCTLRTDLIEQLMTLARSGKFDYIVIEASGICEPAPIAQTVNSIPVIMAGAEGPVPRLDCVVTVVDALRLQSEFGCGEELQTADKPEDDLANLVVEQIEFCNVILLNKISEVSEGEAGRIRAIIRAIQPQAEIVECDYCDVDMKRLLDTRMFDFDKVATSAAWIRHLEHHDEDADEHEHEHHHHDDHDEEDCHDEHCHCHHHHHHHDGEGEALEYGISTFVYYRRRPLDMNRFDYWVARQWPKSVIRCKGVVYFSHNRDMSYLFEQAGVQKKLTEAGYWFATAPEEELERMMAMDPGLVRDWDPEYGDRMVKLVFIGRNMDRKAIEDGLDGCLI